MYDDTIVAIATPPGEGGLGVVRLSGAQAWAIASRFFDGTLQNGRVVHGYVRDAEAGVVVDEVLVTAMAAPRTYTREDVVELTCHGSPVALQRVVALALRHGARMANPGEFTLRAFLNGRIDLAQAEAVLDVIQAKTEAGLRLAVGGLRGGLSERVSAVRTRLLDLHAYFTACIDFPEDEVESQIEIDPPAMLAEAASGLKRLLEHADAGMVYRHGVRTAIVGRPNVGKSSLLNRLLGEDRAIVTGVPGTTRDTVEEVANVRGIPFHLVDTAGMHEARDEVEYLGIQRSRKAVEQADLLLLVVDGSVPITEADRQVLALADARPFLAIANKSDLAPAFDLDDVPSPAVRVSALTNEGLDDLTQAMAETVLGGGVHSDDAMLVTNPRHKAALERALAHVAAARHGLEAGTPEDLVTIDLAASLAALGEITGDGVTEELLDTIFQRFCIGK